MFPTARCLFVTIALGAAPLHTTLGAASTPTDRPEASQDAEPELVLVEIRIVQAEVNRITLTGGQEPIRVVVEGQPPRQQEELKINAAVEMPTPRALIQLSKGSTIELDGTRFSLEDLAAAPGLTSIAAPQVLTNVGQTAAISMGRAVPYLERDASGCLVVRENPDLAEGIEISVLPASLLAGGVLFNRVSLTMTSVASRAPIEGVPFDVGMPTLSTRTIAGGVTVPHDGLVLMALPRTRPQDPAVLVLLSARKHER